jgi:hypothetical protein
VFVVFVLLIAKGDEWKERTYPLLLTQQTEATLLADLYLLPVLIN